MRLIDADAYAFPGDLINEPTINPESLRPKVEWINIMDFGNGNCFGFCSVCKTEQRAQNATALKFGHRYCRYCGADMRGKNHERKAD